MEQKTLIIVDPQNDFISGTLPVPNAENVINNIIEEINSGEYSNIIVTLDWHPVNHCSFDKFPVHCVKHTWGSAIDKNLSKVLIDSSLNGAKVLFATKGENAEEEEFGAFSFFSRSESVLDGLVGLSSPIYICGMAGDYCVSETIRNLNNGYYVNITVIKDCVASLDGGTKLDSIIEWLNLKTK